MHDMIRLHCLRLLKEAKDRVDSVQSAMQEAKQQRFEKRADTIVVKLLDLADDIRCS